MPADAQMISQTTFGRIAWPKGYRIPATDYSAQEHRPHAFP